MTTEPLFLLLFFTISFVFIGLYFYSLRKRKHPYLLYFGLFLMTISVNLLEVWQMTAASAFPMINHYISYGAGTFFLLFYEQIFGHGWKNFNRRLWQLHLLSWALIILASLFSMVKLEDTYLPYSILNMTSIVYVAIATITKAYSGNRDAKIFTFGLVSLIITLIFDISFAIKLNNYAPMQTATWGLFIFTSCLTVILLKRYREKGADFIYESLTFHRDPIALKMKADAVVMHTLKNEIHRLLYLNERNRRLITSKDALEKNFTAMDDALNHMNNMIQAVKKTDDIILKKQTCSLNEVVREALSIFQTRNSDIEVEVNLAPAVHVVIDPLHLKECITNLLSNSAEAIEHQNGKILISLFFKKNKAILEVTDNGKGIPREHLEDVITPLFTTKRSVSHYGVGLYYVYFVINKHGGTLSIPYSEIGKGTTVRIELPAKKHMRKVSIFEKNKSHAG